MAISSGASRGVQDAVLAHPYVLVGVVLLGLYVGLVNRRRFDRLNAIKKKYGFTDDPKTYTNMTPGQAQEVEHNLAEFEMPWLYEFAWLFDFLRVSPRILRVACLHGRVQEMCILQHCSRWRRVFISRVNCSSMVISYI